LSRQLDQLGETLGGNQNEFFFIDLPPCTVLLQYLIVAFALSDSFRSLVQLLCLLSVSYESCIHTELLATVLTFPDWGRALISFPDLTQLKMTSPSIIFTVLLAGSQGRWVIE
jgi:hypothetical protein